MPPASGTTTYYPVFVTGTGTVTPFASTAGVRFITSTTQTSFTVGILRFLYSTNVSNNALGIGIPSVGVMDGDFNTSFHGTGTVSGTSGNTLIGYTAGGNGGPTGNNNTMVGYDAGGLLSNRVNANNTLIGADSGRDMNSLSSNNIMLGVSTPAGGGGNPYTDNIYIGNSINTGGTNNRIHLGTSTHTRFDCLAIYNNISSGTVFAVNINSSGTTTRASSSIRYKTQVEPADYSFSENIIFNSQPKWFKSLCEADNPDWSFWGFIAEEVAEIDPRLVIWETTKVVQNEDGLDEIVELENSIAGSVAYDRFVVHLVAVAQNQKQEIDTLKQEISILKQRLDTAGIP